MKDSADTEKNKWFKYAKVYDPIKCASIDGTDCEPHDRAVIRALNSEYRPNRFVKGQPECTIFISRLNHDTSKDTIKEVFSTYGEIKRFRLVRDIVTGMPKGYGFVEYEEEHSAEEAYRLANRILVDGKPVFVDFECERLLKGWKPRRLGGGFGGKKESGQLRFGGRDRPFKKPVALELEEKRKKEEAQRKRDKERRLRDKDRRDHRGKSRDRKRSRSHGRENGTGSPSRRESYLLIVKRPPSPKLISRVEKKETSVKQAEEKKTVQNKASREKDVDVKPADTGRNLKSLTTGDTEKGNSKNPPRPLRSNDRRSPRKSPAKRPVSPKVKLRREKRPLELASNYHRKSPVAQQQPPSSDCKLRHHSPIHVDRRAEEPSRKRHVVQSRPTRKREIFRSPEPPRHPIRASPPRGEKEGDRRSSPQARKHYSPIRRYSPVRQGGVSARRPPSHGERMRHRSPINPRKPHNDLSSWMEDRKGHFARRSPHRPPSPSYHGREASPPRRRRSFSPQFTSPSRHAQVTDRYISPSNDKQYYHGNALPYTEERDHKNFQPSSMDFRHPPPAYHPSVYSAPENIGGYPPPTREFSNFYNEREFGAVRGSFGQREETRRGGFSPPPPRHHYVSNGYHVSSVRGRTLEASRDMPSGNRGINRREY